MTWSEAWSFLQACRARLCRGVEEAWIQMLRFAKIKGVIMKCPICADTPLVMAERQGVEIDYCPACRGIWLDRGVLDKLLDRAAVATPSSTAPLRQAQSALDRPYPSAHGHGRDGDEDRDHYKRKKSWLHEIFD